MHNFSELIDRCTSFTLSNLEFIQNKTFEALKESSATIHIKNLQMINLQKTFFVVGVFSFYESLLQDRLNCDNGFQEVRNIFKANSEDILLSKFKELQNIINTLKHGKGRSYQNLIEDSNRHFNIKVKQPNEFFFEEGNVDEITALIEVNDEFIVQAIEVINEVTSTIKKYCPEVII